MANARTKTRRSQAEREGWKQAERPQIEKWVEGLEVTGVLKRVRQGQYGPLLDIDTEDGMRVFGVPTILESMLDPIPSGTEIRIICNGQERQKSGHNAWLFDVFTREQKSDD